MPEVTYKKTGLFGGAITASLPADFDDASDIRQVPDNQEVYLSRTGFTSIIVEITERVQQPDHPCTTDQEALLYHYQDLIAAGYSKNKAEDEIKEESKIWSKRPVKVDSLGPDIPAFVLLGTQRPEQQETAGRNKPQPDFTGIVFAMIRLEAQQSDILVTVNVPHMPMKYDESQINLEEGKTGALLEQATVYLEHLLKTFIVQDWTLFAAAEE